MLSNSLIIKRWFALGLAGILLVAGLTVGSIYAANERPQSDALSLPAQLPTDGADFNSPPAPPAALTEHMIADANTTDHQVTAEADISDALSNWLDARPEVMGTLTVADAMSADDKTISWLLYQATYKGVMTDEEAAIFRNWYDRRPSTIAAPELLDYQPVQLDRPNSQDTIRQSLREAETD